jgi:transporter family protein
MPWYFFALLTSVFYSFTNILEKFLLEKRIKDPIVLTVFSGFMTGIIGVILGFSTGFQAVGILETVLLLFSGVLLLAYIIPYFDAMKLEDASRVVPLFQFIPVISFILSAVFLKETLSVKQIAGMVLVVGAGIALSLKKIEGSFITPRKSLWLMLLSSFMYASIAILFRFVVKDGNFWSSVSYQYMGAGIGAILLFLFLRTRHRWSVRVKEIHTSLGVMFINHCISLFAQVSESYAVSLVAVPFVYIIGGVQPVFVLVFGIILTLWFPNIIQEDIKKTVVAHKLISVLFMFLGLFLVYA